MQIIDAHRPSQCPRKLCAALTNALKFRGGLMSLVALVAFAPLAHAEAPRYAFAVIANTMQSPADEAPTQRLIEAISRDREVSFIVYDGNLKGAKEACRDALYERRHALLETSRPALFFIPGQHDWADCGTAEAGGFDPVERLDQLRQTLFTDSTSMGQNPIALTRESEVSRFRPFRENVRWQVGDTVFVGLNAPSPNNHYLTAGGRNGEFEDRVIANAFWLEHAAEYAKRRDAHAIVVFIQGDPDPERYERPDRFAWLRFTRNTRRDGFLEFKRSLVKLAQIFRGPVLVIHCDDERASAGFVIDQPLRNDKGMLVTNLTRVALAPHDRLNQWIQIKADLSKKPPFRVSVRDVPRQMPMPTAAPLQPREEPAASMPAVPALGPASELPPLLQAPGQPQPVQPQREPAEDGSGEYGPAMSAPPASAVLPRAPGVPSGAPGTPASSVQRGP
ncbi:hypothetical protein R69927_01449 [Paraburkholderia domus]|uniref:hypothetical protein n=1 Tax=Paraburkholderia domus TaxID=2793075 RepID=UPI0019121D73|nr:hypothetical protein [Paraburkholderia domus]MBK5048653.1 hypothetical protein [Burkholderia sp. R-70006]MBK5085771.1 hypothetical protein [Burkholderia sp. R-69927]MBK5180514.1 hypothetical protein [Burkholderia sp. R-69749]MCI0146121.1 hypothetical protein [Paraburkholderia sediminicola]CAE6704019.1 hypothetical protein R70006_00878 [Paraburkholderia domus]